jgi:hypothetical protein
MVEGCVPWSNYIFMIMTVTKTPLKCMKTMQKYHYAKIALLIFYPFRKLEDIQLDGSYWNLFHREL